ncbi:SLAM family member 9-like [Rhinichthys klamathensis goyatoka]|uniref:SLAM family member 9-like n=1 Tax=Rhinichthys klamathensis goyatoka TaxID=3034132 RepID=UPI0024B4961A|nr:SLAM family member 9-like [Rhinichthys klamathensis goyatoka]
MLRNTVGRIACFYLFLQGLKGVFGAGTDEVKSVSVTEGDSVTLNTDVQVQRDDHILWMFGPQETRIAEIHRQNIYIDGTDIIFEKILQMDNQTGSLTIRNIRTEHTGLYKLQIISRGTSYKRFNVSVYAPLANPVITNNSLNCSSSSRSSESRCSLVCSVLNVSDVTLSWYKGISVLSSISASDLSISLSLPLDVEYQDKNTYSCVINNPVRNQTTHLDISQLCHTCEEGTSTVISVYLLNCSVSLRSPSGVLLAACISAALLLVLAGLMYFLYRKRKRTAQKGNVFEPHTHTVGTAQSGEDEVQYAETGFFIQNGQKKKANDTEETETIYSSIAT